MSGGFRAFIASEIRPWNKDVTDGAALVRRVIADPGDDLLRLIYADWLEEAGEQERAAFIRHQVEASGLSAVTPSTAGHVSQWRREWALPGSISGQWPTNCGGWEWRRGFPEIWHCPFHLWAAHGAALAESNPISRVVLTDRQPQGSPRERKWTWYRDHTGWLQRPEDECVLPGVLFDRMEEDALDFAMFDHARCYSTREAALLALSEACLQYARATPSELGQVALA